jgi:lipopolysaccharide export system permease protein
MPVNTERVSQIPFPPIGGILDRYLIRGFLKILVLSLFCLTIIHVVIDFFDRIDNLMQAGSTLSTAFRYFLYKLPLVISRTLGFAVLFATLFSLGLLSRNQEITALRASGLSLHRISLSLLLFSVLISAFAFFWNESLVPIFTRKSQSIYKTEIKKTQPQSLVGTNDIWMRGEGSFVSVAHFDPRNNILEGISLYLLNRDFSLKGLIEAPWARWDGTRWEVRGGTEWTFLPDNRMIRQSVDTSLPLVETPEDFKLLAIEPEEFSFSELRKQIADLKAKGIDSKDYEVDLHAKMAIPLVSPLLVFLAIPFALKYSAAGGWALSFGFTMVISFAYWVILAFSISLGHSGALPSWAAAWTPNLILAMVGLFFSMTEQ